MSSDVTPNGLVKSHRHFGQTYRFQLEGWNGGNRSLQTVGKYLKTSACHIPEKNYSIQSRPREPNIFRKEERLTYRTQN